MPCLAFNGDTRKIQLGVLTRAALKEYLTIATQLKEEAFLPGELSVRRQRVPCPTNPNPPERRSDTHRHHATVGEVAAIKSRNK